jgi:hypothetical protein
MSFHYLGSEVIGNRMSLREIRSPVSKTNRMYGCLNNTVWNNKYLQQRPTVRNYRSVIRPIATHVAETRPDVPNSKQMMETTEKREHWETQCRK